MKTSKLILLLVSAFIISCSKSNDDPELPPTLTTANVSGIGNKVAISGGNITSDNGHPITARGVVWSTTENPTIVNSKTTDGTGTGSFTSNITGLTVNTAYYLRAYATNSGGTAYGNQVSFTTTNLPVPGTTREFIIDITHDYEGNTMTSTVDGHITCMFVDGALFDMDVYAKKYTVHFYDMMRTPAGGGTPVPYADKTYTHSADAGLEILNGTQGNYTYVNWYNPNPTGSVTRFTPENKLFVTISWCGTGDCINDCAQINGKVKVTVHY